jgi:hypothetical protein
MFYRDFNGNLRPMPSMPSMETSREINLSINSEISVYPSGDRRSGAAAGLG